jgi:large subunit ribosomal protein L10
MPTARKIEAVAELTDALKRATLTIVADYRGLTVADLQQLRAQLRPQNAEVKVAKNTLTTIAARETDMGALEQALAGPTALVVAYDDPVQPAKIVSDFARTSRILQIRAAMLEGALLGASDVEALASLPSKDVLIGRVVGGISGPLYGIVGVLAGPLRGLLYALNARAAQLSESETPAA